MDTKMNKEKMIRAYLHRKPTGPIKPLAILHVRFQDVQWAVRKIDQRPLVHLPTNNQINNNEAAHVRTRSPRCIPRRREHRIH